ncbi:MAG TPA: TolC family protein [Oculatellaceae cyanobacterium]
MRLQKIRPVRLAQATRVAACLILMLIAPAQTVAAAVEPVPRQNPAGMTELPKMRPILPSIRGERQPLSGDMQQYERTMLRAEPIKLGALIEVASMRPLMLDSERNQPISLKESLQLGAYKNLSLRISHESEYYQKTVYWNYLTNLVPSLTSTFALTSSNINSGETNTYSNVWSNRITFPVFTGGNYSQFIVAQKFRTKGWHKATVAARNDALLEAYKRYTNLALQYQLLRIKVKGVELSSALLKQQQSDIKAGTSTRYALMSAQSQLKTSEQELQDQQVATRKAALQLSYSLDLPLSINLVPTEIDMPVGPMIRGFPKIGQLLQVAYNNNPELREYEYFRLAAARDIQIGMASYYPTISAFLAYTRSNLTYTGSSSGLAGAAVSSISGGANPNNVSTSNTALGQTASLSPGSDSEATGGANTSSSTVVASSGGTPMANIQSGTLVTSGSVAPSLISPVSISGSSTSNINGSNTASSGTSPGLYNTLQAGFSLSWSLGNGGVGTAANIVALRGLARQALLQSNQKLQSVSEAIRSDYTSCLSSLAHIESSASALDTNEEELRLSQLSLKAGNATITDFERAKSNYISGLSTEAQSIVSLKQSEAQLQHDLGIISVDSLTKGVSIDELLRTGDKH